MEADVAKVREALGRAPHAFAVDALPALNRLSTRLSEMEAALKTLAEATERYHEVTLEYFSDTEYDRNGVLAESDAELLVIALPKARAALQSQEKADG